MNYVLDYYCTGGSHPKHQPAFGSVFGHTYHLTGFVTFHISSFFFDSEFP